MMKKILFGFLGFLFVVPVSADFANCQHGPFLSGVIVFADTKEELAGYIEVIKTACTSNAYFMAEPRW